MPKLTYTTPPPSLMRELREVATDAGALATELGRANRLPADFPVEDLQELLVALQSAPAGTAEGSREKLEYARAKLPAIRRQFIQTEEQSLQPRADADAPPPLTRGMTIDVRIGALVNSVATALDEYRSLASIQHENPTDTSPSLEIDATAPDAVNAIAAARSAEQVLGARLDELERIADPSSVTGDNLKRQMRDTRALLSLARIELRMPAFVPRWYRKTIDTISDYPRILRGTVTAMRMGIDVARPLADAWHRYVHGSFSLALNSLEHAATELALVATKWEAERTGPKDQPARGTTTRPPDFDLAAIHAMILQGVPPPLSWRAWITELRFAGTDLRDLAPLAGLTALQHLDLASTEVSNVAVVAELTRLQTLSLSGTRVTDVVPLAGLTVLQFLNLRDTEVSDLAPLAGLTALQSLNLDGTQISDVAPLAGLIALEYLDLGSTKVNDVAPLAELTRLQTLSLSRTRVSHVAPLAGLTALQTLNLRDTGVSDVGPLASLTALQRLYLEGTQVIDVAALAHIRGLERFRR